MKKHSQSTSKQSMSAEQRTESEPLILPPEATAWCELSDEDLRSATGGAVQAYLALQGTKQEKNKGSTH